MKYTFAADGGGYVDVSANAPVLFPTLDSAPLYNSHTSALRALKQRAARIGDEFITGLRIVRVDEVVHAGETKEVRRKFSEPMANGTISTRYEVNQHCVDLPTFRPSFETVDGLLYHLTDYRERCPECGTFTVEAIDTVQLPPYTTRVASELK
jgi:hypothetical protein